jgi:NAD(P)-dependent dehydrogenase (short-subunit alcohol dehydrogenase family)
VSRRLADKVCFITGATGIAEATALRFGAEGASLFVASLNADDCESLAARVDGPIHWVAADLTDEAQVERAFANCLDHYGRLDALFSAVGGSGRPFGDTILHDVSLDAWRATLALNLDSAFLCAREATRAMRGPERRGGSIVFVSSVAATDPVPGVFDAFAYGSAKGGVNALTISGASHYGQDGIRFNAIAPALTLTPMAGQRVLNHEPTMAVTKQKMPLPGGAPLDPTDHAELALFLCSDESRHITGQIIKVDGGWAVS